MACGSYDGPTIVLKYFTYSKDNTGWKLHDCRYFYETNLLMKVIKCDTILFLETRLSLSNFQIVLACMHVKCFSRR